MKTIKPSDFPFDTEVELKPNRIFFLAAASGFLGGNTSRVIDVTTDIACAWEPVQGENAISDEFQRKAAAAIKENGDEKHPTYTLHRGSMFSRDMKVADSWERQVATLSTGLLSMGKWKLAFTNTTVTAT